MRNELEKAYSLIRMELKDEEKEKEQSTAEQNDRNKRKEKKLEAQSRHQTSVLPYREKI